MESGRWRLQPKHWAVISSDDCRLVLRKMWPVVSVFLTGPLLADYMIKRAVLTEAELSAASQPQLQRQQQEPEGGASNARLLKAITDKGKEAMHVFMEGLLETEQPRLYDLLLAELQNSTSAILPCYSPLPLADTADLQQLATTGSSDLVDRMTASESQLLVCPVCHQLMREPVLLACLHTCCRCCVPEGTCPGDQPALDFPVQVDESHSAADGTTLAGVYGKHVEVGLLIDSSSSKQLLDVVTDPGDLGPPTDSGALHPVHDAVANPGDQANRQRGGTDASNSTSATVTCLQCPVCHERLPGGAECLVPNRYVAGCIALLAERLAGGRCRRCTDKGFNDVEGVVRCLNCAFFMCASCAADHDSFLKSHTVISTEAYFRSSGGAKQAVPCVVHRCDLDFFCEQCGGLHCSEYLKRRCLRLAHTVVPMELSAFRTRAEIAAVVDSLWPTDRLTSSSLSSSGMGSCEQQPPLMPLEAGPLLLRAYMTILQRSKRELLDTIESAYEAASDQVELYCSQLERKAADLQAFIGHIIVYCRTLLRSSSDVCLVEQRQAVLSQLQRLQRMASDDGSSSSVNLDGSRGVSDTGGGLASQLHCSDCLVVERLQLTADLKTTIKELIGEPRIVAADPPRPLGSLLAMAVGSGATAAALESKKEVGHYWLTATSEVAELKQQLSDRDAELSELRAQLDALRVERDSLQQRRVALEDEHAELRVQRDEAVTCRLQAEADLHATREQKAKCERLLIDSREAKSHVDYELKMLRADFDRVRAGGGGGQLASWHGGVFPTATPVLLSPMRRPALVAERQKMAAAAAVAAAAAAGEPSAGPGSPSGIATLYRRLEPSNVGSQAPPGVRRAALLRLQGRGRGDGSPGVPTSPIGVVEPSSPGWSKEQSLVALVPTDSASSSSSSDAGAAATQDASSQRSDADGPVSVVIDLPDFADAGKAVLLSSSAGVRTTLLDLHVSKVQQLEWLTMGRQRFYARLKLSPHTMANVKCVDIAVTRDGCLVLATQKGIRMFQHNQTRDVQIIHADSSYKCVTTLCHQQAYVGNIEQSSSAAGIALVAGNKSTRQVEVLSPGYFGGTWHIVGVPLPDNLPWCLAVDCGETVVAVGSGRQVHLVRLDGSDNRKSLGLNFTVLALALTDAVLVVASGEKQEAAYAIEGRSKADPYSLIWRRHLESPLSGLHRDRYDNCYVLLARSPVVHVLSPSSGLALAEITLLGQSLHPIALAFDADCHWLAVLLSDKQTLACFEVRSSVQATETDES